MAPPSCTGRFGWSKPGTATHVILIALIHRITDASRVDRMTIWRKLIFADKCHHAIKRVADNLGFRNPVAPDELKIHLIISHETTDSPTIFFIGLLFIVTLASRLLYSAQKIEVVALRGSRIYLIQFKDA